MKKHNGMRKATAFALTLAMTAGLFIPGTQAEAGEEKETLTIGLAQNSNVEDYETNYLTQLIEQECNVNLEFVYLPSAVDDAKSKFAIMASSNTTLPDVVVVANNQFTDLEIADYGSKGIFIPLNEYLEIRIWQ